ncbi:MAG: type IV secretory system conjugative DNA transfer family protein [Bdellovibrionales bacterium]
MLNFKSHIHKHVLAVFVGIAFSSLPALANAPSSLLTELPPTLKDLENIQRESEVIGDTGMPLNIRLDALKEAAVSFGARGGLAARTYSIRKEIDKRAGYLDKVYNFNHLLVPAPSGLLIEPPIVSEAINATLVDFDGQQAAVSDRIYNIINNARIVSAPRNWRTYIEREWGDVEPPPDLLRPQDDDERETWIEYVRKGWEHGTLQADEIFQEDLNLLNADFQGMIRYRVLLSQGMISPPHALQVDRGITGDGEEMRIGDRAVQITGVPELMTGFDGWQPASR